MFVSDSIHYIGVSDREIDLFEGQYQVPEGMRYNSYLVQGDKTAVLDTVDGRFVSRWLEQLEAALAGGAPDYLVVHHMEPDHSAGIAAFKDKYPTAVLCASEKVFGMMKNFFGTDYAGRRLVLGEGSKLDLGGRSLTFLTAPMVHWPEVLVSWDDRDKALFSADGFGTFGAGDSGRPWVEEARRYYIGIVGKYGGPVQTLLKKAAALDIRMICPLHGPVLKEDLGYYLDLYDTWSGYRPEDNGVLVAYATIYGHTGEAAKKLAGLLEDRGMEVTLLDLARCDMSEAVAQAFRRKHLVLASSSYNGRCFPVMEEFLHHLTARTFRGRTVGLVENGSWGPVAARIMKGLLEPCKDLTWLEPVVTIRSALNEQSEGQLVQLAEALSAGADGNTDKGADSVKYICDICGWIYDEAAGAPELGVAPGTKFQDLPEDFLCPLCAMGKDHFSPAE